MATSSWLHGSNMLLTDSLVSVLKEQRSSYLPSLLASYREHGVLPNQCSNAVGGLVGYSSAKLGSSKTKFEGLCLLSVLVKDSSSEVFQQHCLSWLRSLQQVIQSQAPLQTIQLAVNILHDLLQYSSMLPELAREVGLNSVLGILTSLLGLKIECELAAMEGMTACMTYYPRACGSLRDKLAAYFLSKMHSASQKTQEVACACYGGIPCLGGASERGVGVGRAEGWANQVHCLLASANSLLAQTYQGAESEGAVQYDGPGVELPFPVLEESDPLLIVQLQHRYRAVCLAMKKTLSVDPACAVRLPVRPILDLVCRALAVSPKSINVTGDGALKVLVLPAMHNTTLEVLSALITAVRGGMVQFTSALQRLFSQTLCAWTPAAEATLGQQRAFSSVRVSVYRAMELWVQVGRASAALLQGSPTHSELLFNHLLGEITPGAEAIKLRGATANDIVAPPVNYKPGPRCSKPLARIEVNGPSLQRKGDALANQETCVSALRALRRIILTSGTLLKDDMHKRLHDVVIPLCVRLQQQASSTGPWDCLAGASGQYAGPQPRLELYRLLLALVLAPSPRWAPPLNCAVSVLSHGCRDRSLKVSSFCTEALTVCNSLLHPRTPSLSLPLPPLVLKAPPAAPVQGPPSGLALPTLLGGPGLGPSFPARHTLGLLGSLDNHLPMPAPLEEMLLPHGHHQGEPGPPEGQRPVFVRYDKEEAEDVEISLGSDSDDSVVIVPRGMLGTGEPPPEEMAAGSAPSSSQTPASARPGCSALLAMGESEGTPAAAATVATAAVVDGASLPNDLSSASVLTTSTSTPVASFPPSGASLVSLMPSLSSGALAAPPGGPGDSLAVGGGAQLQQMLIQPSAASQAAALPLQLQQLHNQLGQPGRGLHHHQQPPGAATNNEDSAVININSSDDEDEDMEDEDELEDEDEEEEDEEEDEEEEEEEEEEESDFLEEFADGEDYLQYGEEEEEEEEDEEEDGEVPPLQGAGERAGRAGEAAGLGDLRLEADAEGGIEEILTARAPLVKQGATLQEVESIGVLEKAREGQEEEDEERMDDPTMPQILCVTGGALEEPEEEPEEEHAGGAEQWEPVGNPASSEEQPAAPDPEEEMQGAEPEPVAAPVAGTSDSSQCPESREDQQPSHEAPTDPESSTATSVTQNTGVDGEPGREVPEPEPEPEAELEPEGQEGEAEEVQGVKRKREVLQDEEAGQSTEKKKLDEEAMASMLADFIACPPDDEDAQSGSTHS